MTRFRLEEIWKKREREQGKDISRREVVREAGVALSTIQKVLDNENVEVKVLEKLAKFFGVKIGDLIDE